jgi:steroid Delta-isomerase
MGDTSQPDTGTMTSEAAGAARDRLAEHVTAFNAAARSGDWARFTSRFTPDGVMRFAGVPAGPFIGRDAISRAYAGQPPADTITVAAVDSAGSVDSVRFARDGGSAGVMRLTWQDELVAELEVTFGG